MLKNYKENLTEGPILKKMIFFILPLIATSILQQLFHTADMSVVGRFAGDDAYAAVGSTGTVVGLFIEFFMGFSVGVNVVVGHAIGRKDEGEVSKGVHTAILFSVICGLIIAIIGIPFTRKLLELTSVPREILDMATLYLGIYFCGMPFYMLYNFASAIFRAKGESRIPLYCLIAGGVINVILNLVFVLVFGMGVEGVAIATVISNIVSSFLAVTALIKQNDSIKLHLSKLKLHKTVLVRFIKLGLPSGFLYSVFSISNLIVQSSINSLGVNVISASSATAGIEIYVQYFGNAFAQCATTFISQNYGAAKHERCRKAARLALIMSVLITTALSLAVYSLGTPLIKIFTVNKTIIAIALLRMRYTLLFKPLQSVMDIMVGCLQGYGKTLPTSLISIFVVCGVRIIWIYTYFAKVGTLPALMVIYPITWGLAALSHSACYFWVLKRNTQKIKGEKELKYEK